jgi:hypothetical protein
MDPKARLDPADLARQFNWFKAQGLVNAGADLQKGLDLSYVGELHPKRR